MIPCHQSKKKPIPWQKYMKTGLESALSPTMGLPTLLFCCQGAINLKDQAPFYSYAFLPFMIPFCSMDFNVN
jgi:hypothetical protein